MEAFWDKQESLYPNRKRSGDRLVALEILGLGTWDLALGTWDLGTTGCLPVGRKCQRNKSHCRVTDFNKYSRSTEVPNVKSQVPNLKSEVPAPNPTSQTSSPNWPSPKPQVPSPKRQVPSPSSKSQVPNLRSQVPASSPKSQKSSPKSQKSSPKSQTPSPKPLGLEIWDLSRTWDLRFGTWHLGPGVC